MLLRKQNIRDNGDWLEAFNRSTDIYSLNDIKLLEAKTVDFIKSSTLPYKKICSGWIAGKDSLVLDRVLQKSGIKYTPIMWQGINQYPAMQKWIALNKPDNLIIETIDKFTLEFLNEHPDYLFCQNGTRQRWMAEKCKRYKSDLREHGFDLFVVGRRIKDGNICGRRDSGYIVSKDFNTFSPLAEWTHEHILAYIKYEHIQLPPLYVWKRGFLIGSVAMGEWTERPAMDLTVQQVWEELWQIDKSIVISAADKLQSAKEFLKGRYENENRDYQA